MSLSKNKTIKAKKDMYIEVAGFGLLLCAIIYFFFFNENLRAIFYALVVYIALFMIIFKKYYSKYDYFYHALAIFLTYIILTLILRSSPFLQLKEFEWTHHHWQRLESVQLLQQEVDLSSRKNGYAFTTIIYEYSYHGQQFLTEQSDVCRQYSFRLDDGHSDLMDWSLDKVVQGYEKKQYVAFVNLKKPEESIYFYSQDGLDVRGSWFAKLFYFIQIVLAIGVVALFGWGVKKLVDPKDQIKAMPKKRKILVISVLAISLWSLLFFGWIGYMVIVNS